MFIIYSDLRRVAHSSTEIVASLWFSLHLIWYNITALPDRMWWAWFDLAVRDPQYPCGTWLGWSHASEPWTVLPAPKACPGVVLNEAVLPFIIPRLGVLPPDAPLFEPRQQPYHAKDNYFSQKLAISRSLKLQESDHAEMGIKFELSADGTTWRR